MNDIHINESFLILETPMKKQSSYTMSTSKYTHTGHASSTSQSF